MRAASHPRSLNDRLILALDVPTIDDARRLVDTLGDLVTFYKLGMWLLFQPGADSLTADLLAAGKQVFLDYKLHDIGETVKAGTSSIAKTGATFLTVHSEPQVLQAAVAGAANSSLGILAVTVLTSLDDAALRASGVTLSVPELVARRARAAATAGCAGIIAAATDNPRALKEHAGRDILVITPGIRMPGDLPGDQRRTATPAEAIHDGADYLVIGRPILHAPVPQDATRRILDDMSAAAPPAPVLYGTGPG